MALGLVVVFLPWEFGVVVAEDGVEAPLQVGTTALALVHRRGGEGRHALRSRRDGLFRVRKQGCGSLLLCKGTAVVTDLEVFQGGAKDG